MISTCSSKNPSRSSVMPTLSRCNISYSFTSASFSAFALKSGNANLSRMNHCLNLIRLWYHVRIFHQQRGLEHPLSRENVAQQTLESSECFRSNDVIRASEPYNVRGEANATFSGAPS